MSTVVAYTCKKCGPVTTVLHGEDERMHCMGCDSVVTILTAAERRAPVADYGLPTDYNPPTPTLESAIAIGEGGPKRPMTAAERVAARKDADRGRAILRAMEEREKARRAGLVKLRAKRKKEAKVPKGDPTNRMGDCQEAGCGRTGVYLLSKNPPRCAGCTKRAAVAAGGATGGVANGTKRKKKVAEPTPVPVSVIEDDEVRAIDQVLRAMRPLDTMQRSRVIRYAAEWCKAHTTEALALPG